MSESAANLSSCLTVNKKKSIKSIFQNWRTAKSIFHCTFVSLDLFIHLNFLILACLNHGGLWLLLQSQVQSERLRFSK